MQGRDWMVDEQISRARQAARKAVAHFPCLLHARKHPPWIGSRGRRATLAETCRAQGILPTSIHADDWNQPTELCRMLGNSMSANVLLKVIIPILKIIRPDVHVPDPWSTGRMQHLLRQSARSEIITRADNPLEADGPPSTLAPATWHPAKREIQGQGATCQEPADHQIRQARRRGAIFEELAQILGPGITPRELVCCPWLTEKPPPLVHRLEGNHSRSAQR